jgi:hypothetical protein
MTQEIFEVAFALLFIVAIAAAVWFLVLGLAIGFRIAILAVGSLYQGWKSGWFRK